MTVALLNDLKAEVIFLPKSANTIFDNYFTYLFIYLFQQFVFSIYTISPEGERHGEHVTLYCTP
jgi:hypothetical protein